MTSSIVQFKPLTPAEVVSDTLDHWFAVSDPGDRGAADWATKELCARAVQAFYNFGFGSAMVPFYPTFEIQNVYLGETGVKYVGLVSTSSKTVAVYKVRRCGRLTLIRRPPLRVQMSLIDDFRQVEKEYQTASA